MFKLTNHPGEVVCVSDYADCPANTTIPKGHRFWGYYQEWLAKGNAPQPADPIHAPSYAEKRKARYTTEADPLKNEIEEDAMLSGAAPDYGPWLALKAAIRADIPKD